MQEDPCLDLKEVIPNSLLFSASPSNCSHSAFPLIKMSVSEVSAILQKFVLIKAASVAANLNFVLAAGHVYVTSVRPTSNRREREKLATDLSFFTRSAKSTFSKRLSTSLTSMVSFQSLNHVWLKIIWLKSRNRPQ